MDTSLAGAVIFTVSFAALYAAHPIGDYWVQTDHQARHKGDPDRTGAGRLACLSHVAGYVMTQNLILAVTFALLGLQGPGMLPWCGALAVSGVTHYWVDRRWTLAWLASLIPGKSNFYKLGAPRPGTQIERWADCDDCEGTGESVRHLARCWTCSGVGKLALLEEDNPTLGTGAWALDQSFHMLFSVLVPALILGVAA